MVSWLAEHAKTRLKQAFSKGHSAPQEDAKPSKVEVGRKNSPPVVLHAEE